MAVGGAGRSGLTWWIAVRLLLNDANREAIPPGNIDYADTNDTRSDKRTLCSGEQMDCGEP